MYGQFLAASMVKAMIPGKPGKDWVYVCRRCKQCLQPGLEATRNYDEKWAEHVECPPER